MYTHIKHSNDLKAAIKELEAKEQMEKDQLVAEFRIFKESMKPANLLKQGLQKIKSSPGVSKSIFKTALSLGAGAITKKLFFGQSKSIVKKLAGNAIKLGVAGVVAKKSNQIKYAGLKLLTRVLGKKKPQRAVQDRI